MQLLYICYFQVIGKSALQFLPIVNTLSLAECVRVSFLRKRMFPVAKMLKKITYIEPNISSRTAQIPFFFWPAPSFLKSKFCILFIMRTSRKCWETEMHYYCYHTATLRMLYIMTLTYNFRSRILKRDHLEKGAS